MIMRKKYTKPYLEVYKIDVTLLLQETTSPGGDNEIEDPGAIPPSWSFTKPSSSAFKTRTSSTEETSSSDGGFGSGNNNSPF